ncbi:MULTISPECIES: hypothetical protein [Legionella]|uniref:Uncharacterized protein n=1 Tax=Legionella resiliens TaxID=2905958 RepID=A0ABS8XAZ7_9GAMM|nr:MULTISPECIES: hypothetical protein [unclassified Legionella]MCE0724202.1 hypothetical protein [Legionella sp. 9fVS26]MCE3533354.1 hypothetical protein [Legionella sp. 8cVS16]
MEIKIQDLHDWTQTRIDQLKPMVNYKQPIELLLNFNAFKIAQTIETPTNN